MSSEDEIVGKSGSGNHDAVMHNLGIIMGQLGHLSHIPDKLDRMNREIGELKARIDIIDAMTAKNTKDIETNTADRNIDSGADAQKKLDSSFAFSILSFLISLIILVTTIITSFFTNTPPTP